MTTPVRIQRKREKGFSLQASSPNGFPVVYVGRPGPWGNPFKIGEDATWADSRPPEYRKQIVYAFPQNAAEVVANYRAFLSFYLRINDGKFDYADIRELRGKNLACFCPLVDKDGKPVPCHADVLLEIANSGDFL